MQVERTVIEESSAFRLDAIRGVLDGSLPFAGFALRVAKAAARLKLRHSAQRQTVSRHVAESGAFAGVNGGFYVSRTGLPLDWLVVDGGEIGAPTHPERPCLCLAGGDIRIGAAADARGAAGVLQAGPLLLRDGRIVDDYAEFRANAREFDSDITAERYPRTLVGVDETHVLLVVVDGRAAHSAGLYLLECAELCRRLDARDAMNIDGGGSSAMVVGGRLLNRPRAAWGQAEPAERSLPAALLVFLQPRY